MAPALVCRAHSLAPIALLGLFLAGCASTGGSDDFGSAHRHGVGIYMVGSPYEENGVWYYPAVDYTYDKTGTASWYGAEFDGKLTANGEIYDMNRLTAAHTTLPMPSIVQVTDLQNGRSLRVRVNDRGPFADGRIIDLSRRAAQLLGFETQGTASVRVTILKNESIAAAEEAMRMGGGIAIAAAIAPSSGSAATVAPMAIPADTASSVAVAAAADWPLAAAAAANRAPQARPVGPTTAAEMPLWRSSIAAPSGRPPGRLYVQAGAFSMRENARRVQSRISGLGSVQLTVASVNGIEIYRVRLGPIASADEAGRLLARVVDSGYPQARIVGD
jgi:rare lipoprotein A